jgi:hypothetical protein
MKSPSRISSSGEQLDRLVVQRKRRHYEGDFARNPNRFATRRQQPQLRARAQESPCKGGARVKKMLTIVEQDQQPPITDEPNERVVGRATRLIRQAQRPRHRDGNDAAMGDRCQVDVPHAVGSLNRQLSGDLDRQASCRHHPHPSTSPAGSRQEADSHRPSAHDVRRSLSAESEDWAPQPLSQLAAAETRCADLDGTAEPLARAAASPAAGACHARAPTHRLSLRRRREAMSPSPSAAIRRCPHRSSRSGSC